jgi:hypothetical protein
LLQLLCGDARRVGQLKLLLDDVQLDYWRTILVKVAAGDQAKTSVLYVESSVMADSVFVCIDWTLDRTRPSFKTNVFLQRDAALSTSNVISGHSALPM